MVLGTWSVLGPRSVLGPGSLVLVFCLVSSACAGNAVRERNAAAAMDDVTLTARVKTALLNDRQIDATRIGVSASNGVVTLSGTVKTPAEAARAGEPTRQTPGVKAVNAMARPEANDPNYSPAD